ncbi:hypothetical protein OHZ10_29125 [Burkholderia arboris]|uniref:Uncharacterized protein n=1 Tax=Burkholderia arboris TaxID=488730 RepID=A0ABZ3DN00_9BURK
MSNIFVQFSDASEATVTSVFGCQQEAGAYPHQGEVAASDARYLAYLDSLPEAQRQGLPTQ